VLYGGETTLPLLLFDFFISLLTKKINITTISKYNTLAVKFSTKTPKTTFNEGKKSKKSDGT
jgi:hypothetical protein